MLGWPKPTMRIKMMPRIWHEAVTLLGSRWPIGAFHFALQHSCHVLQIAQRIDADQRRTAHVCQSLTDT